MSESVMSKHTPGPWFATRNIAYWEVVPNNPGMGVPWTVADICPSDPGNPDGGLQEANARLIAAAPEMLEAIEETLQSVVMNRLHDTIEISRDAIELLRAALAKAKGGE